jgi:hypothetical protein
LRVDSGEWRVSQCGITNVLVIIPLATLFTINIPAVKTAGYIGNVRSFGVITRSFGVKSNRVRQTRTVNFSVNIELLRFSPAKIRANI